MGNIKGRYECSFTFHLLGKVFTMKSNYMEILMVLFGRSQLWLYPVILDKHFYQFNETTRHVCGSAYSLILCPFGELY